ncbi:MAG: ketol-acid reductoisomerase [Vulcanimicrobiaceae bacterium]
MKAYYDRDNDPKVLAGRTIAVIGYGSQGRAHAQNLHDSGVNVVVGLRAGSTSRETAKNDGIRTASIEDAVRTADIVMILTPDEEQPAIYLRSIRDNLQLNAYLAFAHGFGIHFGTIVPPKNVNVFMVAPKGPGRLVRTEYEAGRGVPCLIAIHQDPSGDTRTIAMAYACAIGGGRAGILETNFKEETESDLFGEQAVLCGGVSELITAGFETLVEAGYAPEMAYFECLHEMKLIIDLMYERGIEGMRNAISNTAKYGDYTRGKRVIAGEARAAMKTLLAEIQSGAFAQEWIAEHAAGKPRFAEFRAAAGAHQVEEVGARLRDLMPWMRKPDTAQPTAPAGSRAAVSDAMRRMYE